MEGELIVNEDIEEGAHQEEEEDEEENGGGLSLSAETIAALKLFALDAGIPVLGNQWPSWTIDYRIIDSILQCIPLESYVLGLCSANFPIPVDRSQTD